jgi:hypothetical protein
VLTIYGVTVLTFMMVMYALEERDRKFILAFALGCAHFRAATGSLAEPGPSALWKGSGVLSPSIASIGGQRRPRLRARSPYERDSLLIRGFVLEGNTLAWNDVVVLLLRA